MGVLPPNSRVMVVLGALAAMAAAVVVPSESLARGPGRGDPFTAATVAVVNHRSEKVRVQAALVLGRTHDPRAVPFLVKALADPRPTVRAMAAKALGDIGDPSARVPLEVATHDDAPLVRRHAELALKIVMAMDEDSAGIDVSPMADGTGRASPALRARMRQLVQAASARFHRRGLAGGGGGGYAIDGTIKTLGTTMRGDVVEVTCAVQLVLSTRRGAAIIMMTSGEAVVERSRRQYRPSMQPSLEIEALDNAVRGAADELRQHFANVGGAPTR
jgi:hypothetical protein